MGLKSTFNAVVDYNCSFLVLPLLMGMYFIGELGHFLITTVSRNVAQDLEFGDKGCLAMPLNETLDKDPEGICKELTNETSCIGQTYLSSDNITQLQICEWDYNGLGLEYQLLAGPAFMACFTVAGVVWGILADKFNRVYLLGGATIFYSLAIIATSLATEYWHLVLFRIALAAGAASTCPLAASMIGDIFGESKRALAMGVYNWGIYLGYGTSFALGTYVTDTSLFSQPWRTCFFISGIPGLIVGVLFLLFAAEPRNKKKVDDPIQAPIEMTKKMEGGVTTANKEFLEEVAPENGCMRLLKRPEVLILAIAASVRHSGGYTGGYNSALYFQQYYPEYDAAWWLFGVSIGGGALGTVIGGYTSDRLVKWMGISARALVLAGSQLISFPFTLLFFYLDPPYAFIASLVGYLTSEMWFGIMYAILVELFPARYRTTAVALALFLINNFGGNFPVVVEPLRKATDYRTAVVLMYPGAYLLSSILFFICWFLLRGK